MTISELVPGTTFRFASTGKEATLLYLSPCGATVRFAAAPRHVVLPSGKEFDAAGHGRPVTVSAGSEVEV